MITGLAHRLEEGPGTAYLSASIATSSPIVSTLKELQQILFPEQIVFA
jgi:hypothetical protein